MKTILLSQGKVALVDDEDFERLSKFKWYTFRDINRFYAARNIKNDNGNQRRLSMHRDILNLKDSSIDIDHKNHDGLDNRRQNLRICTRRQNAQNRRKLAGCASNFKGVSLNSGKWRARIKYNKKRIHLGYFISEQEAANAYLNAAQEYFGEFACAR